MLAAGSRHGRRCHRRAESSWQAMVSVKNFHRSARARPPPPDTPDESSAVTTSQVTPSIQDFAVSLVTSLPRPKASSRQIQVMARGDVALLKPGLGQVEGGSVYVVPAVSRHARLSAPDELSAMAAAAARTA